MKKNLLELFCIVAGFLLSFLIPIRTAMLPNEFAYFLIMLSFAFVVLAFMFLSIARMRMSRIDFALRNTILSWSLPKELAPKPKNYSRTILLYCAGAGVILFVSMTIFASMDFILSLLIASILTLFSIGLTTIGWKRIEAKRSDLQDFILTHNAFVLYKDIVILDGARNAIFETALEGDVLKLGLKRRWRQIKLSIPVPQEQKENVQDFLDKLGQHFKEQNEVFENGTK